VFKRSAEKLTAAVKAAKPGASVVVVVNEEKPRKGAFEVKVGDTVIVSLTNLPRPFAKLRALDLDSVAADVVKAL
jgi:hypothetical protein